MKNKLIFVVVLLFSLLGCTCKKERDMNSMDDAIAYEFNNVEEYMRRMKFVNDEDFSYWADLVDEDDFTCGPLGNALSCNVINTPEAAAMVSEAVRMSVFRDRMVEDTPKMVIARDNYWVVIGPSTNMENSRVCLAVIQKSNGKILDFKMIEKMYKGCEENDTH